MKRKLYLIILLVFSIVLVGCQGTTIEKKEYIVTVEFNNGEGSNDIIFEDGDLFVVPSEDIKYEGHKFLGWYLDEQFTNPLPEDYIVTSDLLIYAKWEIQEYKVIFYVDDEIYDSQVVKYNELVKEPTPPTKPGYIFRYWGSYKDDDTRFNFYKKTTADTEVYAKWVPLPFGISYNLGFDAFATKNDLYESFFTDFYNFMIENTDVDMSKYKIENVDHFLEYCSNWNAGGKSDLYGAGDAFAKYYVKIEVGGKLENQPTTHFIGYCYQNNKYEDFIPFLMQFFAYWRTDEGYTGGASDPNNTGNDFFASAWASLVDTCKFFYFTSQTLNDKYPWFNSERVKDALDNIPSVLKNLPDSGDIDNPVVLPMLEREGYIFKGWTDENGNAISIVKEEMTVYANWEKK